MGKISKDIVWAITVFALIVVTLVSGSFFAFKENSARINAEQKKETRVITLSEKEVDTCNRIYKYNNVSVVDNETVSALINDLDYLGFSFAECGLSDDGSFLNVCYQTDSRSKYRFMSDYKRNFTQSALIMFSLIKDLPKIRFSVSDDYGEFYNLFIERASLAFDSKTKMFTDSYFENATKSQENFTSFFNTVSRISYPASAYAYERKIYTVLDKQSELVEESKTAVTKLIAPATCERLEYYVENANRLANKKCGIVFYTVNDYTTNALSYYVFFFNNNELITYNRLEYEYQKQEILNIIG